nr:xylulose kinase-1 [Tanacetum cinerariifolium]
MQLDCIFGKTYKNDEFEQIVDFLNANPIKYALTVSPTIYTSCIKQFWTSAKVKTVNDDVRIQALVDGKKVVVNKASIRRDLRLDDAEGTARLPNDAIFEEVARIWVLSLEQTKTNQAAKIKKLKKRLKKLEGKKKKRTHGLKRLYKVSMSARIVSSDEEGLEQDATVAKKVVTTIEVATAATSPQISKDELTLVQTLKTFDKVNLEQHHFYNLHMLKTKVKES